MKKDSKTTVELSTLNRLLEEINYRALFKLLKKGVGKQSLREFSEISGLNKTLLIRLFSNKNLPKIDDFQKLLKALNLKITIEGVAAMHQSYYLSRPCPLIRFSQKMDLKRKRLKEQEDTPQVTLRF